MIQFRVNKSQVEIQFDMSINWNVTPVFNTSSELYAILLKNQLQKDFGNLVSAIRKEMYEQGWKDKSSHKRKATWFTPTFKTGINAC